MALPSTPRHQHVGWLLAGATALGVSLSGATALGQQPLPPPPPPPPAAAPPATAAPPPTAAQPPPGYSQQQQPPPGYYQQQQPPPGYYQQAPPGYYPPPGYYYQQPMDEREQRRQEALMKEDWPMKSPGMVIAGTVVTAVGGIGFIAGTILLATGRSCSFGICTGGKDNTTAGLVVVLVSGVALAVGIPLIVVGRKKVPPPRPEPVASVHVGPQGGAFTLQF